MGYVGPWVYAQANNAKGNDPAGVEDVGYAECKAQKDADNTGPVHGISTWMLYVNRQESGSRETGF